MEKLGQEASEEILRETRRQVEEFNGEGVLLVLAQCGGTEKDTSVDMVQLGQMTPSMYLGTMQIILNELMSASKMGPPEDITPN
jgi:hypothetical protein